MFWLKHVFHGIGHVGKEVGETVLRILLAPLGAFGGGD
jgi:hypothetical protein